MIQTFNELGALRGQIAQWKREGLRVALVPTMGNLHGGHHSLVALARQYADKVVASIFVNPTQFGPNEDFSRYPRTPEADVAGLEQAGCDAVWLPSVEAMYPLGVDKTTRMHAPGVSEVLEGASRPGHFDGVCTVVARLFLQVQPDVAVFGRKDYQQLAVIKQMVAELSFPVQIVGAEIVRDEDGLAKSSRNQYLSAERVRSRPPSTGPCWACAKATWPGRHVNASRPRPLPHCRRPVSRLTTRCCALRSWPSRPSTAAAGWR